MSGVAIEVVVVCQDVKISIVARKLLQTFLVTSTFVNDLLLGLTWLLCIGARMTVVGCGTDTQVVIAFINEDSIEMAVRAMFSDNIMQTLQGLMISDNLVRDQPSGLGYMPKNSCLHSETLLL